MLLVGAILLAVFVLPAPWNYVAVIAGAVYECFETGLFIWYTRRRRPTDNFERGTELLGRQNSGLGGPG